MSVTESERAALRTALTEEIGEDSADILMRSTLPQGPDRLATKDDLKLLVANQTRMTLFAMLGFVVTIWFTLLIAFVTVVLVLPDTLGQPPAPVIAIAAAVVTIWATLLVGFVTLISVLPDTPAQPPPPPAASHHAGPVQ